MKYWAYLHSNGNVIVKPWYGDHQDYTTDCENNPFVQRVIPPFESENEDKAKNYANLKFQIKDIVLNEIQKVMK